MAVGVASCVFFLSKQIRRSAPRRNSNAKRAAGAFRSVGNATARLTAPMAPTRTLKFAVKSHISFAFIFFIFYIAHQDVPLFKWLPRCQLSTCIRFSVDSLHLGFCLGGSQCHLPAQFGVIICGGDCFYTPYYCSIFSATRFSDLSIWLIIC